MIRTPLRVSKFASIASIALFSSVLHAQTIDDFGSGALNLQLNAGDLVVGGYRTGTMVGGVAYHSQTFISNPDGLTASLSVEPASQLFTIANGNSVQTGSFAYYGHGSNGILGNSDLNLDLSASNRFHLEVEGTTTPSRYDVAVFQRSGSSYNIMYGSAALPVMTNSYVDLAFSSFNAIQGQAFQFNDVDAMYLYIPSGPSASITVKKFSAVPDPACIVTLLAGFSSFIGITRLRQRR